MTVYNTDFDATASYNGTTWVYGFGYLNLDNVYSASMSTAGAVSAENKVGWISFTSLTDTSLFTYTLNGFTSAPNCYADYGGADNPTATLNIDVVSTSATQLVIRTGYTNSTSDYVKSVFAQKVICQKSGTDYLSASANAYATTNTNTNWTSYTPTFTGFGTPTQVDFKWKRDGGDLLIQGYFNSGNGTATQARISLPNGLIVDSNVQSSAKTHWGTYVREFGGGTTAKGGVLLPVAGQSYFVFGDILLFSPSSSTSTLSATNGDTIGATNVLVSVNIRIPIQGWSNAPFIVGSFQGYNSTPGTNNPKTYSFTVDSAGGVSNDFGDLINGSCTSANPNVCTVNAGKYTSLNCTASVSATGTAGMAVAFVNTSTIDVQAWNTSGTPSNNVYSKKVICHGE
jgi:hypothetical protein